MYSRILHLIHTPRLSGAEMLVRDLCLRHAQKGISSAIASFAPAENGFRPALEQLAAAGTRLYVPARPLTGSARRKFFRNAYTQFKPDVVYAHSVLPALYGRLALQRGNSRPRFVSVLHGAANDDYGNLKLRLSELLLARRGDAIFAVSEEGAGAYKSRIRFHRPVEVVPNGADITRIRQAAAQRDRYREQLGLRSTQQVVLQVGRLSPVKQQQMTLAALIPQLKARPDLQLWFAGLTQDQAYADRLQQDILHAGLHDQAKLLGGRDDVPGLLAASDLYVMPSTAEAHSIAMIEALASGIAVVGSDIPTFRPLQKWPGVRLVGVHDQPAFAEATAGYLHERGRHPRDMGYFDIDRVAGVYGAYA